MPVSAPTAPTIVSPAAAPPGLTTAEVLKRREQYGENVLPTARKTSALALFFGQFKNPLVYIILAAAGISLAVGEYGDLAIIMAVVLIDAVLGFVQEYQAQRTYTALRGLLKPTATVIRDGARQEVEVRELVSGDVVLLNAGERIPGDGRVLEATRLTVEEAILTGESEPVAKGAGEGENGLFMGTTVLTGRGLMEVTTTGVQTELGQIATSLHEEIEEETPLQVRLKTFKGRSIAFASFAVNSMIYIFAYRSMRRPIFRMTPLSANKPLVVAVLGGIVLAIVPFLIPGLREALSIKPLHLDDWLLVGGVALGLLVVVEIGKAISNRVHRNVLVARQRASQNS